LQLEDNARPHVSKLARAAGKSLDFTYLDHPPYSSDLAPSDCFLFSNFKKHLKGTQFNDISEAKSAVMEYFEPQPTSLFKRGMYRVNQLNVSDLTLKCHKDPIH